MKTGVTEAAVLPACWVTHQQHQKQTFTNQPPASTSTGVQTDFDDTKREAPLQEVHTV